MTEDDDQTIEPVALLRIPEWEPPEELDVRLLDDGALVFLSGADFGSEPEELWIELLGVVGDAIFQHEDERGVFFLPDAAEPEDVDTYEGVIAAVGDQGLWVHPSHFGAGAGDLFAALQSGDPDAMKLAHVQAQSMLEQTMRKLTEALGLGAEPEPKDDDASDGDDERAPPRGRRG